MEQSGRRRSKKKRYTAADHHESPMTRSLELANIQPMTDNQALAFDAWDDGKHLMMSGSPGTGKTFLSAFMAMQELLSTHLYDKVVLLRSVVPTRDIGFLPGNIKEKTKVYELPYIGIFTELFGRGDAYEICKSRGQLEFEVTSFIRGTTFKDCIIIVDESQNLTAHELYSVITRVGQNCRIIFAGDYWQSDLKFADERNGILGFTKILDAMPSFSTVTFTHDDIVRSDLVKEFIITKDRLTL